ncbi:MAG: ribosomal RNA small subunit methyltransferase A [Nitrospinota bacterium]|nr:MAG: ribosomal RNA small subunit methyltransferase A [Nitrospinota bacterium]
MTHYSLLITHYSLLITYPSLLITHHSLLSPQSSVLITRYSLGMKPKKHLGQHFLVEPAFIRKIVETADIQPEEVIIEIGPGTGKLTEALLQQGGRVFAIELDQELVTLLRSRFASQERFILYHADALAFPYASLPQPAKVVANLPYNIASPLILKLLGYGPAFSRLLLTVQREVAERIVAGPGGKEYGVLSLLVQYRARARICFRIPPTAFSPRPRVFSALLELVPYRTPPVVIEQEASFIRTIKAAFAHRRKTVKNSLKQVLGTRVSEQTLREVLVQAGIEERRRAETLSLEDFARLSNLLFSSLSSNAAVSRSDPSGSVRRSDRTRLQEL